MGTPKFLSHGEREGLKGGVHAAAALLVLIMAGYNLLAWIYRRQPHLGVNAGIYGALLWWECGHVRRHWGKE